MTEEDWRVYSWQRMLDQAGKHAEAPKNPKANPSTFYADRAVRDLRTADHVVRTKFNRVIRQV